MGDFGERTSAESAEGARYVMALDCGHRVWTGPFPKGGAELCALCRAWVGVIVTRVDSPADLGRSLSESASRKDNLDG